MRAGKLGGLCEHQRPRKQCHACSGSKHICKHNRRIRMCRDCTDRADPFPRVSRCSVCKSRGHYAKTCARALEQWTACDLCGCWHRHLLADASLPFVCADVGARCPAVEPEPSPQALLIDWAQCDKCDSWIEHRLADKGLRFECADAGLLCLAAGETDGWDAGTPAQEHIPSCWTDELLCVDPCASFDLDRTAELFA